MIQDFKTGSHAEEAKHTLLMGHWYLGVAVRDFNFSPRHARALGAVAREKVLTLRQRFDDRDALERELANARQECSDHKDQREEATPHRGRTARRLAFGREKK